MKSELAVFPFTRPWFRFTALTTAVTENLRERKSKERHVVGALQGAVQIRTWSKAKSSSLMKKLTEEQSAHC